MNLPALGAQRSWGALGLTVPHSTMRRCSMSANSWTWRSSLARSLRMKLTSTEPLFRATCTSAAQPSKGLLASPEPPSIKVPDLTLLVSTVPNQLARCFAEKSWTSLWRYSVALPSLKQSPHQSLASVRNGKPPGRCAIAAPNWISPMPYSLNLSRYLHLQRHSVIAEESLHLGSLISSSMRRRLPGGSNSRASHLCAGPTALCSPLLILTSVLADSQARCTLTSCTSKDAGL